MCTAFQPGECGPNDTSSNLSYHQAIRTLENVNVSEVSVYTMQKAKLKRKGY